MKQRKAACREDAYVFIFDASQTRGDVVTQAAERARRAFPVPFDPRRLSVEVFRRGACRTALCVLPTAGPARRLRGHILPIHRALAAGSRGRLLFRVPAGAWMNEIEVKDGLPVRDELVETGDGIEVPIPGSDSFGGLYPRRLPAVLRNPATTLVFAALLALLACLVLFLRVDAAFSAVESRLVAELSAAEAERARAEELAATRDDRVARGVREIALGGSSGGQETGRISVSALLGAVASAFGPADRLTSLSLSSGSVRLSGLAEDAVAVVASLDGIIDLSLAEIRPSAGSPPGDVGFVATGALRPGGEAGP